MPVRFAAAWTKNARSGTLPGARGGAAPVRPGVAAGVRVVGGADAVREAGTVAGGGAAAGGGRGSRSSASTSPVPVASPPTRAYASCTRSCASVWSPATA
ncbi:hypothetical protein ACLQ22_24580 [Micromonospora sp. DT178]|uniref:hypothetical protein n=1 Tax=Micromonospora sp. DT178 TaxID=3393436 RepID=UPI003CF1E4A1